MSNYETEHQRTPTRTRVVENITFIKPGSELLGHWRKLGKLGMVLMTRKRCVVTGLSLTRDGGRPRLFKARVWQYEY